MIISLAMDDRFADEGPNIKPMRKLAGVFPEIVLHDPNKPEDSPVHRFKDIFPPIDVPKPDRVKGIGEDWFRRELRRGLDRPKSNLEYKGPVRVTPSGLEYSTMSNLGEMLKEYMPDWIVTYTSCDVPGELRTFFVEGDTFVRATYTMQKYDKALFIHIDFKSTIEIYIIHQKGLDNVARRVYTIDRADNLALFRIITSELENTINGDFKNVE